MSMKRCACAKRPRLDPALPWRTQRESAMSDLQIGLAMLGVLLVAAVLVFNWWQERQFRQRGEKVFSSRHDDVLLNQPATQAAPAAEFAPSQRHSLDEPRIEPSMEPQLDAASQAVAPAFSPALKSGFVDVPPSELDYIAEIRAVEFIAV